MHAYLVSTAVILKPKIVTRRDAGKISAITLFLSHISFAPKTLLTAVGDCMN